MVDRSAAAAEGPAALQPEEGAAHWFVREHDGVLTGAERAQRDAWLRRGVANRTAYERVPELWSDLGEVAALPQMRALREAALSSRGSRTHGIVRWAVAVAVMATIAFGIVNCHLPNISP